MTDEKSASSILMSSHSRRVTLKISFSSRPSAAFKGRRTRLVAKCKPEKQRASELAKWVRDCHLLIPLARPTSLSPHPTWVSFVLLSPRSLRHLLHSLFATDLKEGLCRSLSHLEVYLDLDLDHTIGMVHWVTRFRYLHRGPPFAPA